MRPDGRRKAYDKRLTARDAAAADFASALKAIESQYQAACVPALIERDAARMAAVRAFRIAQDAIEAEYHAVLHATDSTNKE